MRRLLVKAILFEAVLESHALTDFASFLAKRECCFARGDRKALACRLVHIERLPVSPVVRVRTAHLKILWGFIELDHGTFCGRQNCAGLLR